MRFRRLQAARESSMLGEAELSAGLMALGFAANLRTHWAAGCGEY